MKKLFIPAFVLLTGIGAALGSQAAKSTLTNFEGYRLTGNPLQPCENTHIICTDFNSGIVCTNFAGNTLYKFNGTGCPTYLYKL